MKTSKITVDTKIQRYQIIIGANIVGKLGKILNKNSVEFNKCLLIIDKKIPKSMIKKILVSLKNKKKKYFFYLRLTK